MGSVLRMLALIFLCLSSCAYAQNASVLDQSGQRQSGIGQLKEKPGLWESIEYSFYECWDPKNFELDAFDGDARENRAYHSCISTLRLSEVPPLEASTSQLLVKSRIEYLGFRKASRDKELFRILLIDPQELNLSCAKGDSLVTIIVAFGYSRIAEAHGRQDLKKELAGHCLRNINRIRALLLEDCATDVPCNRGMSPAIYGILGELNRYGGFSK